MRVCDRCKDIRVKPFEYRVTMTRPEQGPVRTRQEQVKDVTLDLCPDCVGGFWRLVEDAVAANLATDLQATAKVEELKE